MTAPFAALQTRLNAAVLARLANAYATLGGASVAGIYDSPYARQTAGEYGMASTQPTLTVSSADAGSTPAGLAVVVNSLAYTVTHAEPDGSGLTRLYLERA